MSARGTLFAKARQSRDAIGEVDVWRIVVTPEEADNDSKEFTNFWHNIFRLDCSVGAKLVKIL